MDMHETHEEIIILAEIAGINKENLGIEINSRAVRIYGDRTEMSRVEDTIYKLAEIQYGIFERILFFSSPIDINKERGRINFPKQAHRFGSDLPDLELQKLKE